MGGDDLEAAERQYFEVSTHAPAWGATLYYFTVQKIPYVSTHAPAWGATASPPLLSRHLSRFNSRPRMGGDKFKPAASVFVAVSTHAPAWGATGQPVRSRNTLPFQLTPPHGGRRRPPRAAHPPPPGFNSRPRMGGDGGARGIPLRRGVSTHAPAWGATSSSQMVTTAKQFQLTPPHGGRLRHRRAGLRRQPVSTHAPAWGATMVDRPPGFRYQFQLTPPHGGRPLADEARFYGDWFQLTPPHGGRPSAHGFPPPFRRFQLTPPHGGRP